MAGVEPMTQIVHRGKLASRSTGGVAISDTLCTSGLMDDVIFAHKPRLLDVAAQLKCSAHAALGFAINCAQ